MLAEIARGVGGVIVILLGALDLVSEVFPHLDTPDLVVHLPIDVGQIPLGEHRDVWAGWSSTVRR